MKHFRDTHFQELFEESVDPEIGRQGFEFIVSNVNFDNGLALCVDNHCMKLDLHEDARLKADFGTIFHVYDAKDDKEEKTILTTITVELYQKQIMLRKEILGGTI